jgi:hypothetical protein
MGIDVDGRKGKAGDLVSEPDNRFAARLRNAGEQTQP